MGTDGLYTLGLYEKAMPEGMAFSEMLQSAKETGFDRLEISIDETDRRLRRLDWTAEEKRALRAASDESGVRIETACLSGHRRFPLGSRDAATRMRAMDIMKKAVDFAAETGVRVIQLAGYDVYYEEGGDRTRALFLENLKKSAEIASGAGVLLGFETMETPFMDTVQKAMRYVELIRSPYLGVYPDVGNLTNASVLYGSDLSKDIETGRGHIFAAHLKETRPGVYRGCAFGDGHTEYLPAVRTLWRQGVRMFTGEFWYRGETDNRAVLRRSARFLRDRIETAAYEEERDGDCGV